jgi:hypothetical protein
MNREVHFRLREGLGGNSLGLLDFKFFRHQKGLRFLSKPLILYLVILLGFKPRMPAL